MFLKLTLVSAGAKGPAGMETYQNLALVHEIRPVGTGSLLSFNSHSTLVKEPPHEIHAMMWTLCKTPLRRDEGFPAQYLHS